MTEKKPETNDKADSGAPLPEQTLDKVTGGVVRREILKEAGTVEAVPTISPVVPKI
jgi:hypothetical protein